MAPTTSSYLKTPVTHVSLLLNLQYAPNLTDPLEGTAVAGQQQTYFPHKGVLSPAEGLLYVSYSDGTGPYDGTLGAVHKYDIANATWTDITPVSGSDLSFGFGGLAVDVKNPGTLMVAALNLWWPDGQIYRSKDRCVFTSGGISCRD